MNAETKSLSRFEETSLDAEQLKSVAVGIDELLVKSFALFNRRIDAVEKGLRSNHNQVNVLIGLVFALAGLMIAIFVTVLSGVR